MDLEYGADFQPDHRALQWVPMGHRGRCPGKRGHRKHRESDSGFSGHKKETVKLFLAPQGRATGMNPGFWNLTLTPFGESPF